MSKDSLSGIAIISMNGRFPGASDIDSFWEMLRNGREGISFFTAEELIDEGISPKLVNNPNYVRARGILSDIDRFDARFFGYSPREAELLDPQQRIFLECCTEALEAGGYTAEEASGPIGVFAGSMGGNTYLINNLLGNAELRDNAGDYQVFLANEKDGLTTRVAYKLNLRGPAVTVQTACSTSLVAVAMACQSLIDFQCDLALAGGVSITIPQKVGYLYTPGMVVSPDGHCRAFDANAQGTLTCSGVGVVLLKRLEDAIDDRDPIIAVIRGWATNNDGADKVGYTAPSVRGQADCITQALEVADVNPDSIGFVEAHGTGTPVGDPIEAAALTQAFRASTKRRVYCALGSVKSNVGHLEAAAGIAGLIKAAQAIKHAEIPPSLHFATPNPEIDFANSPFYVNTTLRKWPKELHPRRAGVSSFGVGGTNAHVVLEQAPPSADSDPGRPFKLLILSARSRTALDSATLNLQQHLQEHPELDLADVAYTLQIGRRTFTHRRMVVCADSSNATEALRTRDSHRVFTAAAPSSTPGVVFMFSGQGSQYVNMCHELYQQEPFFREQVDLCADYLLPELKLDLRPILFPKESEREQATQQLNQTAITQPALFTIEYALAKLWMELGIQPVAMIGHSLGEYVAACVAGVLSLRDAVTVVAHRGWLMQHMPTGAMLAVPLSEDQVRPFLTADLSLSAINSPTHCVIGGPLPAIDTLEKRLAEQKLRGRRLHTSHAFHSSMMSPILKAFSERLSRVRLNPPQIRYISNLSGRWITPQEATDPTYYARHLRSTVRFSPGLEFLLTEPDRVLLEIGPGATLSILAKQHPDPTTKRVILSSLRGADGTQSESCCFLNAMGRLWLAGCPINFAALYKQERRRRVPLPTYPFERERFFVEPTRPSAAPLTPAKPAQAPKPTAAEIDTYFYKPSWRSSPPPAPSAAKREQPSWLVLINDHPLGLRIAQRLRQQGQAVTTVRCGSHFAHDRLDEYKINPSQFEDYERLIDELNRQAHPPRRLVHLWNIGDDANELALVELPMTQDLAYFSLTQLARALASQIANEPVRMDVITSSALRVHPDEQPSRPERALVSGPCKVIPIEYRNIACQHIDIDAPNPSDAEEDALTDRLIAELGASTTDPVLAYRGLQRFILQYRSTKLPRPTGNLPRLRQGGAYLITGGLGGIGMVLAEYLARSYQAKLILSSREGLPTGNSLSRCAAQLLQSQSSRGELLERRMRQVENLERLGAQVMVVRADVSDLKAMQAAVDAAVEQFGPIRGVIHSAGVPSGGVIQLRSRKASEAVLAPKVTGTLVLDTIFKKRDLDFFLLCSSLNAVLGGFGQADYTAANAFLDAFAQYRSARSRGLSASINWDAWREVGMAVDSAVARQHGHKEQRTSQQTTNVQYRELVHPLFERFLQDDTGATIYATHMRGPRSWVIDEHRIHGRPTLPETAYLELARAAYELHRSTVQAVELRDVAFVSPLVITEGRNHEVRTVIRPKDLGPGLECEFGILSRKNSERQNWQEHARGRIAVLPEAPLSRHDIERLMRDTPLQINLNEQSVSARQRNSDFGVRWQNLVQIRFGRSHGLAFIRLPEGFHEDLATFVIHPALLDSASSFVSMRSTAQYVPISCRRLRILRALPECLYSYATFESISEGGRERLHINLTLMDTDGVVLLEAEDYVLVKETP